MGWSSPFTIDQLQLKQVVQYFIPSESDKALQIEFMPGTPTYLLFSTFGKENTRTPSRGLSEKPA
jgi:hypothetical protein